MAIAIFRGMIVRRSIADVEAAIEQVIADALAYSSMFHSRDAI